jgi:hypothetical protein
MISPTGNVNELLHAVAGGPFGDIVARVTAEKRAAEALAKASSQPLRDQMFNYTQSCRCLKFWLTTHNKPRNCAAFALFQPLTAALVQQGSLPPAMLAAFG